MFSVMNLKFWENNSINEFAASKIFMLTMILEKLLFYNKHVEFNDDIDCFNRKILMLKRKENIYDWNPAAFILNGP